MAKRRPRAQRAFSGVPRPSRFLSGSVGALSLSGGLAVLDVALTQRDVEGWPRLAAYLSGALLAIAVLFLEFAVESSKDSSLLVRSSIRSSTGSSRRVEALTMALANVSMEIWDWTRDLWGWEGEERRRRRPIQ